MNNSHFVAIFIMYDENARLNPPQETFSVSINPKNIEFKNVIENEENLAIAGFLVDEFLGIETVKKVIQGNYFYLKEGKQACVVCTKVYTSHFISFDMEKEIGKILAERLFTLTRPKVGQEIYLDDDTEFELSGGICVVKSIDNCIQGNSPEMTFKLEIKELPETFIYWNKQLSEKQESLAKKFCEKKASYVKVKEG